MRGSSPTRTQSAFTSSQPASRATATARAERLQQLGVRIDLADALVQAGGRDLDRDPRLRDAVGEARVQLLDHVRLGAHTEDLHEVGMREHVEEPAAGGLLQLVEVPA